METMLILFGFALLIFLMATYSIVSMYRKVWKDWRKRSFKHSASRERWRLCILLVPIFGMMIYHTIFVYEPPSTG